jgi:hypothetical protein
MTDYIGQPIGSPPTRYNDEKRFTPILATVGDVTQDIEATKSSWTGERVKAPTQPIPLAYQETVARNLPTTGNPGPALPRS